MTSASWRWTVPRDLAAFPVPPWTGPWPLLVLRRRTVKFRPILPAGRPARHSDTDGGHAPLRSTLRVPAENGDRLMSKESRAHQPRAPQAGAQSSRKRAKRNRLLATIGAAVAVIALVVGGGYLIVQASNGTSAEEYTGTLAPRTLQEDGSVVMALDGVAAPSSRSTPTTSVPLRPVRNDQRGHPQRTGPRKGKRSSTIDR